MRTDAILNKIKTYMSKINLQAETTNSGEQEEQREKTDMLSPGNPWSQSRRRNDKLWWEGFAKKESFKP